MYNDSPFVHELTRRCLLDSIDWSFSEFLNVLNPNDSTSLSNLQYSQACPTVFITNGSHTWKMFTRLFSIYTYASKVMFRIFSGNKIENPHHEAKDSRQVARSGADIENWHARFCEIRQQRKAMGMLYTNSQWCQYRISIFSFIRKNCSHRNATKLQNCNSGRGIYSECWFTCTFLPKIRYRRLYFSSYWLL